MRGIFFRVAVEPTLKDIAAEAVGTGVGVAACVGVAPVVAVTVAAALLTIAPMLAEPTVLPLLLYPRQIRVWEPLARLLVFHGFENVKPFTAEYVGEVASQFESTNRFSKATCDEFETQVKVTVPATDAPLLGLVI